MDLTLVRELDDVSARAVPAAEVKHIDGWVARRSPGLATKRANSVFAREPGSGNLDERIDACEPFYGEIGLPPRYQLTPASRPLGLRERLLGRGYVPRELTIVQTCAVASVLERLGDGDCEVEIAHRPTVGWWRTWRAALNLQPDRLNAVARMFERLRLDAAFAVVRAQGEQIAVGLGILDHGWVGIFNMATIPEHRRRGAARTTLAALAAWARESGGRDAYLQVDLADAPARGLYELAGFRDVYRYEYMTGAEATRPPGADRRVSSLGLPRSFRSPAGCQAAAQPARQRSARAGQRSRQRRRREDLSIHR